MVSPRIRSLPPGVYYRNRRRPYKVEFRRKGRIIYVGSYHARLSAFAAAKHFLEKERAQ